jgi:PBS lyase HEAT-like repeat
MSCGRWTAALGAIGDRRAVEPLLQLLASDAWQFRSAAAAAIGQIDDGRIVEPRVARLADVDWFGSDQGCPQSAPCERRCTRQGCTVSRLPVHCRTV